MAWPAGCGATIKSDPVSTHTKNNRPGGVRRRGASRKCCGTICGAGCAPLGPVAARGPPPLAFLGRVALPADGRGALSRCAAPLLPLCAAGFLRLAFCCLSERGEVAWRSVCLRPLAFVGRPAAPAPCCPRCACAALLCRPFALLALFLRFAFCCLGGRGVVAWRFVCLCPLAFCEGSYCPCALCCPRCVFRPAAFLYALVPGPWGCSVLRAICFRSWGVLVLNRVLQRPSEGRIMA